MRDPSHPRFFPPLPANGTNMADVESRHIERHAALRGNEAVTRIFVTGHRRSVLFLDQDED